MGNEAVVFQSSDPFFSVQTDGSIFAQGDGASLDEPVQFKLTASGPHTHVWETVVQLALIDSPSPQENENEWSGDSNSQESGQNSLGLEREMEGGRERLEQKEVAHG
ncbi:hypothetical protein PFLUV_G00056320 [Perca fluviatilis]|uniref:Uncharacterized protein n=1 Tax=Perca fluviatilis TaxID=8168 RepID=A0A6A5FEP9_PERFL|nr:hypothetical protein PFLUV_G00056320 [Perca fluviatilis]